MMDLKGVRTGRGNLRQSDAFASTLVVHEDIEAHLNAEREDDIENIRVLTENLNALASIQHETVQKQGLELDSAERNIIVTSKNMSGAKSELFLAREYSKKNSGTIIKLVVAAILICILVLILLFFKVGIL